ncbi:MAG: NUDIX hydrolase [Sulfuricella sp.]|nr:NUDIX hydrolase [Sulfuricella sp.]
MNFNNKAGAWAIIYCTSTRTFLLGKRSASVNKPDLWNFFGGHIDPGENPRDALRRELSEEIGVELAAGDLVSFGGINGAEIKDIGYVEALRELHYFLLLTDREIEPRLNHEHSEYRWFLPAKLPHKVNRPTAIALNIGLIQKVLQVAESPDGATS